MVRGGAGAGLVVVVVAGRVVVVVVVASRPIARGEYGSVARALSAIVLFTSLGGTTYAWDSATIVALIVAGVALLAVFPLIEARAAGKLSFIGFTGH